jgi:hypothetical protein
MLVAPRFVRAPDCVLAPVPPLVTGKGVVMIQRTGNRRRIGQDQALGLNNAVARHGDVRAKVRFGSPLLPVSKQTLY